MRDLWQEGSLVTVQMKGSPETCYGCCMDIHCIHRQMGHITWMPPNGLSGAQTQVSPMQQPEVVQLLPTFLLGSGLQALASIWHMDVTCHANGSSL